MRVVMAVLAAVMVVFPQAWARAAEPVTLAQLSSDDYVDVRCTMLAGLLLYQAERTPGTETYGLDDARMDELGDGLAARLAANYGADEAGTRRLLKELYEDFAAQAAIDPDSANTEGYLALCQPRWERAGSAAPAPEFAGKPVDGPFCFVLNSAFASAIAAQAGRDTADSMAFARKANRIEATLLAQAGAGEDVSAALSDASAKFDPAAFDALPETQGEDIIMWCDALAGPDE